LPEVFRSIGLFGMRTRFVLVVALGTPIGAAAADDWVVAEAPAAITMSAAQDGVYRTGVMPAGGVYHDTGVVAFGLRMRGGVLRNGPAPGNNLKDPGVGGLGSGGVAVRIASHGLWIEGVGGAALTGHDIVPAVEAGIGFDFAIGGLDVGPSLRYLRLESHDPTLGSADLLLVGFEVQVGKKHVRQVDPMEVQPAEPVMTGARPVPVERDHDDIVESDDGCTVDGTGCVGDLGATLAGALTDGTIEITDDRIVLDERVVFDTDRARVRSAGREMIAAIATMWRSHPEWQRVIIEGHADVRGPDDYNLALSQRRAELARATLVKQGFAADRIDAVGYGRSRPRDPGTSDNAHHRNRRVEFVIVRHGATSSVDASAPNTTAQHDSTYDRSDAVDAAAAMTAEPAAHESKLGGVR